MPMILRTLGLRLVPTAALVVAIATAAWAAPQCTQSSEASTVKKSIRNAVNCNDRILRGQFANITVVYTNSGPKGGADEGPEE